MATSSAQLSPPPEAGPVPGSRPQASRDLGGRGLVMYLAAGTIFGFIMTRAEAISWFRIQEMFRFHSFHMYGILGSAVGVAGLFLAILKRLRWKTLTGEEISVPPKEMGSGARYAAGGVLFGLGWAMTGACPGPLFALIGGGLPVFGVALAGALAGTWVYGLLRPRLPH